jgi:hypothetical protein
MKIQPLQPEAGAFTTARNLHTSCRQMPFQEQENNLTGLGNKKPNKEDNIKKVSYRIFCHYKNSTKLGQEGSSFVDTNIQL